MLETDNEKCIDITNEVNSSEEDTDLTAGSILFRLPLPTSTSPTRTRQQQQQQK
ncbi:hypothetical protein BC941DRAFT_470888 [Chlamydoabsidia padenii]|nr:hypothetical protein BC941DRAFT_470888 [Chlamydoabsidia padenii]